VKEGMLEVSAEDVQRMIILSGVKGRQITCPQTRGRFKDFHVSLRPGQDLCDIFCFEETRSVG
jgi:hypothetical protein